MLIKIKTTKKPEYKMTLHRIREKKLTGDQNPDIIGLNCDSDILKGPTEFDKVDRKWKGGPRLALQSPKIRGQSGQKKRGGKMVYDDPNQLKLDKIWDKLKTKEPDEFSPN